LNQLTSGMRVPHVTLANAPYDAEFLRMRLDSSELTHLMTPALAIYPEIVDFNIHTTIKLLGGDPERWQPHVKTAKLESSMRQLCLRGVTKFKSSTTLEMLTACRAGATEVLMSYPSIGVRVHRIQQIAAMYPHIRICATVENTSQVFEWREAPVPLYIDVNPGMNRTGIEQSRLQDIVSLATAIRNAGIEFAGLHYYDGHNRQPDIQKRNLAAYPGYEQLLSLVRALQVEDIPVGCIITSGTPALPCALSFPGFHPSLIPHRVSSGTILYNDLSSLSQLPENWGYRCAALVIATVISHPARGLITCDAGHKAVSSDAGVPSCSVLGYPDFEPLHPSEEHLPIRVPEGTKLPDIGEIVFLVPRHVCTTVNNFNDALLVRDGKISEIVSVSARGRESRFFKR
jgi:D-serine deaminase-like pyridoxal phosphate-dependent protein